MRPGTVSADPVERVRQGQPLAIARMITRAETGEPDATADLARLYPYSGRAHIVGVTGAPGSGKSTLVSALAGSIRRAGGTVGILALDPSSPFTGGALLGDRVRMHEHTGDPGVFVRSMASRGALGGLSRATADAVTVLDAAGRDYVLIETVGVGQDEVDIVRAAHTVVVVSIPGTGDDIQSIKSGVLEIADLHVVNKADRDGANRTVADLKAMLRLGAHAGPDDWVTPVLSTVAATGEGVDTLAETIRRHHRWLVESDGLAARERAIAAARVTAIAQQLVAAQARDPRIERRFAALVDQVCRRDRDPFSAATALLRQRPSDRESDR